MQIQLNGETEEVRDGISIAELAVELKLPSKGIAVEVNKEIIPKSKHAETHLKEGDCVEVVNFVGGG